jgi:hypothetical protein
MRGIIEQAREQGWGVLTDEGMVYDDSPFGGSIYAQIGNTWFSIVDYEAMFDYEFMRDVALRVIETSEPVDVEQELDRIRQSES